MIEIKKEEIPSASREVKVYEIRPFPPPKAIAVDFSRFGMCAISLRCCEIPAIDVKEGVLIVRSMN